MENSKSQDEFPTLSSALGNPAKNQTPDSHIPTAPTATGNISKLQDDSAKVTFLNCLTGFIARSAGEGGSDNPPNVSGRHIFSRRALRRRPWLPTTYTSKFRRRRAEVSRNGPLALLSGTRSALLAIMEDAEDDAGLETNTLFGG